MSLNLLIFIAKYSYKFLSPCFCKGSKIWYLWYLFGLLQETLSFSRQSHLSNTYKVASGHISRAELWWFVNQHVLKWLDSRVFHVTSFLSLTRPTGRLTGMEDVGCGRQGLYGKAHVAPEIGTSIIEPSLANNPPYPTHALTHTPSTSSSAYYLDNERNPSILVSS